MTPQSTRDVSTRPIPKPTATLVALTAVLVLAVLLAPARLAGFTLSGGFSAHGRLVDAVHQQFVLFWQSGGQLPAQGVTDYWFRFHAAKALLSALLLTVLVTLGSRLWRAYIARGGPGTALVGSGVVALSVLALLMVMANLQGLVAPLSSLLPLLSEGHSSGELTGALSQVRQQLASSPTAGHPLALLVDDFGVYHAAMAVIAGTAALASAVACVLLVRALRRSSVPRARRVTGGFGGFVALLCLGFLTITLANVTSAADPASALRTFFSSGG